MAELLSDHPISHGGIKPLLHPRLNVQTNGQTAIRYLRFFRPVWVDRLELGRIVYGRWIPSVPTHPAHLVVSVLDGTRWRTVGEVDLPPDPVTAGEGLSQQMSVDEMNAKLEQVLRQPPHVIELGGIETDHLRVECDREHPVWPNHGECNGGPFSVPFGILDPLRAFGEPLSDATCKTPYSPILSVEQMQPEAPRGMRVRDLPHMLLFEGKRISAGFSLRRPLLMHLGWDALAADPALNSRLLASRMPDVSAACAFAGPVLRTLAGDFPAPLWTGRAFVHGNRIAYRGLRSIPGLVIDATFTVEPDRLIIELAQTAEQPVPALEADAWRLVWNLRAGITGAAGVPTLAPGRNGDVTLPAFWATDGVGCLACRVLESSPQPPRLQVESYRPQNCVIGGFVLADRGEAGGSLVVPAGTRTATIELAVTNLRPRGAGRKASDGIRRHWASVFSCFRPEHGGFSNNAASVNCHLSQGAPIEIAAFTARPKGGPDPIELARFTIARALLDGGGYGYWRNLYLDSDPVLVSAAGRIHQVARDDAWLRTIEPGLLEAVNRMAASAGDDGLLVCRDLSGNSGTYRWSTNGMDVVGFGHVDAYVNAWAYRAFNSAMAMFDDLDLPKDADRCRLHADRIFESYAPKLVNPDTGFVAGWLSRDGRLHDYAFLWVNGVAIAFGLLDRDAAQRALRGLERLRSKIGLASARMALPCNLLPIRDDDHMLPKIIGDAQPTFELYTDGSLCPQNASYYLRALSIYGLKPQAGKLAAELEEGFASGMFNGGIGTGHEFRSWDGLPTGYEGTLVGCFGPMYAIAIEQGLLHPPEPEWWP
ncbi:MAG TPA: hypothetical protein VM223_24470 [Planctomycetota bacterium]|nr:hypothetical protein [Planctomycetota bacterium]